MRIEPNQTTVLQVLTTADIAAYTRQRRRECKATNGQYSLKLIHKLFCANNNGIMDHTFGERYVTRLPSPTTYHDSLPLTRSPLLTMLLMVDRLDDLRTWLVEERFPQGWQPRVLAKNGLTSLALNTRSLELFLMQEPLPFLDLLHHREHHD